MFVDEEEEEEEEEGVVVLEEGRKEGKEEARQGKSTEGCIRTNSGKGCRYCASNGAWAFRKAAADAKGREEATSIGTTTSLSTINTGQSTRVLTISRHVLKRRS
jgi:hypothetical protein